MNKKNIILLLCSFTLFVEGCSNPLSAKKFQTIEQVKKDANIYTTKIEKPLSMYSGKGSKNYKESILLKKDGSYLVYDEGYYDYTIPFNQIDETNNQISLVGFSTSGIIHTIGKMQKNVFYFQDELLDMEQAIKVDSINPVSFTKGDYEYCCHFENSKISNDIHLSFHITDENLHYLKVHNDFSSWTLQHEKNFNSFKYSYTLDNQILTLSKKEIGNTQSSYNQEKFALLDNEKHYTEINYNPYELAIAYDKKITITNARNSYFVLSKDKIQFTLSGMVYEEPCSLYNFSKSPTSSSDNHGFQLKMKDFDLSFKINENKIKNVSLKFYQKYSTPIDKSFSLVNETLLNSTSAMNFHLQKNGITLIDFKNFHYEVPYQRFYKLDENKMDYTEYIIFNFENSPILLDHEYNLTSLNLVINDEEIEVPLAMAEKHFSHYFNQKIISIETLKEGTLNEKGSSYWYSCDCGVISKELFFTI